jgi:hypothetical protein
VQAQAERWKDELTGLAGSHEGRSAGQRADARSIDGLNLRRIKIQGRNRARVRELQKGNGLN